MVENKINERSYPHWNVTINTYIEKKTTRVVASIDLLHHTSVVSVAPRTQKDGEDNDDEE